MDNIEQQVRTFIIENFFVEPETLSGDTSLVGSGIIDSTGVMEIILFLDQAFGIKLPDQDAVPANLDTVNNLVAYIHAHSFKVSA